MPYSDDLEIRITFLEDQINKMNLILMEHRGMIDDLAKRLNESRKQIKSLQSMLDSDDSNGEAFVSDLPPDGMNR